MFRDFSEESRQRLLGLVAEVENENGTVFTDWIGDRWYDFQDLIGQLEIKNYIDNVNAYHKKVIDKNNATNKSINRIFDEVKKVDTVYGRTFGSIASTLNSYINIIQTMNEIVSPENGKFTSGDINFMLSDSYNNIDSQISTEWNNIKQAVLDEINDDNFITNYFNVFTEYVGDKVNKYMEGFESYKNVPEAIVGWYDWFKNDLYGDFDTVVSFAQDVIQEYTFKDVNLISGKTGEFFETLSDCDMIIDVAKSLKDWAVTGDGWEAYKEIGLTVFSKLLKEGNKWLDKIDNLKYLGVDKQVQSVLVSTIANMPKNFIEGIENYAEFGEGTAGSIFVDTTIGAGIDAVSSAAKPFYIGATAVAYPVFDGICEAVGYDLSEEYEKLTGKTGLSAVFSAQKELWVDVVYEGAKEVASDAVDGFYDMVSKGWKSWKSGMKLMFG